MDGTFSGILQIIPLPTSCAPIKGAGLRDCPDAGPQKISGMRGFPFAAIITDDGLFIRGNMFASGKSGNIRS
jgi:hypothetical protein